MRAFGFTVAAILAGCGFSPVHANELATGNQARSLVPIIIPVSAPVDLNFKSRDAILGMREKAVEKYPQLLLDMYDPGECFDLLEGGKPWWGLYGLHVYREGNRSIEGPSKESVYLMNPFRLVAAEGNNIGVFRRNSLTPPEMQTPGFPFNWNSKSVKFDARNSMSQETYDVTGYHRGLAKWLSKLSADRVVQEFSLIAYNARDFGLNFMYLDPKNSINVRKWASRDALEIPQMIHCGGSCGYPGGCNNMSPHRAELDNNRLNKLPARAYLKLWHDRPRDPNTAAPDFVVVLDFI